jgi:O-succinylbenzoate synthase
MSDIYVWHYMLKSGGSLNAASMRSDHPGALIRVGDGFACLHPWPELGDLTLAEHLLLLKTGGSSPLVSQALRCAAIDGEARRAGKSLFDTPVPESHWLVLPGDEPDNARKEGFSIAKIKVGQELAEVVEQVMLWVGSGFRIRLDANERLSMPAFLEFWASLKSVETSIDCIEDPTPWNRKQWSVLHESAIPLAVDRDLRRRFESGYTAVVKPAVSNWIPPESETFFVTSYMDHGVGQAWAAVEAARLASSSRGAQMRVGGLLTHRCFEPDDFFDRWSVKGCRLQSPGGTGLGFDDLLEGLPWKRLD